MTPPSFRRHHLQLLRRRDIRGSGVVERNEHAVQVSGWSSPHPALGQALPYGGRAAKCVFLCQLRSSSSQLSHKDLRDASGEPESVSSTGVSPDNDCGQRSPSTSLLPQVLLPQAVRRAPDSVWLRSPMDLLPRGGERARGERESSCLKGFITKPDGAPA